MEKNTASHQDMMNNNRYTKFFLMLGASFLAMYITMKLTMSILA